MSKFVYIVSHTRFDDKGKPVHGTASELAPLLDKEKIQYIYIQHSIFKGHGTYITFSKQKKHKWMGTSFLPFPLRLIQEMIITSSLVFRTNKKHSIFVGVDPLNAWLGIILRKLGKVQTVVFYTADYAKRRYDNSIMNSIYHIFDRFCVKRADQVWNVSSRITSLRQEQGVEKERNYFIPNSPVLKSYKPSHQKSEKHTLVIVTHITKAIDFMSIFQAIKHLEKKIKDLKLVIVGNGDYRTELEKKAAQLKLSKRIFFTGSKSHKEVMEILKTSGVGIALYTNDFPWTWYGDSMKAREYLACGLPVIISDVPSTADDVEKANAGIVIKKTPQIKRAINAVFSNNESYAIMRQNALDLARNSDFARAVKRTHLFT